MFSAFTSKAITSTGKANSSNRCFTRIFMKLCEWMCCTAVVVACHSHFSVFVLYMKKINTCDYLTDHYCSEITLWERKLFKQPKMTNYVTILWPNLIFLRTKKLKCNWLQIFVYVWSKQTTYKLSSLSSIAFSNEHFRSAEKNPKNFNIIKHVKMRKAKQKRNVKTSTALIYGQNSIE